MAYLFCGAAEIPPGDGGVYRFAAVPLKNIFPDRSESRWPRVLGTAVRRLRRPRQTQTSLK